MKNERFLIHGKTILILGLLILCLLLVGAICLIVFGGTISCVIVGIIFCAIIIFITLFCLCFLPVFVLLNNKEIKETSIFGRIKKSNNLLDLKEVTIRSLQSGRNILDYVCLNFSESVFIDKTFEELVEEECIVLIRYSQKNIMTLKKYIHIPIVDERI